ncbi:glutathione S-transferase N-terminal domain-containing protein [Dyella ginsengisoli]|uniref:Glutathione S-transferase N-terminal domain-containing protein n=1 Tax=Dyella ginsengisoli TaxID=363848 RepID=A0ABW8JSJ9_9GAMM
MKLYFLPGASSLAAHIVLEWIGAPYETVRMSHDSLKSPAYRARNATGTVPMLEHGDFTLTENVAILGYLAEVQPETGLLGDGSPRGRAEVMRWLGFLNSDVHKAFLPLLRASCFLEEEIPAGVPVYGARRYLRTCLERLDTRLAGRDWLVGRRSVADPYLLVILRWAVGLDMGLYGLDHLMRFARRMEADPGVQAAILAEEGVLA